VKRTRTWRTGLTPEQECRQYPVCARTSSMGSAVEQKKHPLTPLIGKIWVEQHPTAPDQPGPGLYAATCLKAPVEMTCWKSSPFALWMEKLRTTQGQPLASFSSNDAIGHADRIHPEARATSIETDRAIGRLLAAVDNKLDLRIQSSFHCRSWGRA